MNTRDREEWSSQKEWSSRAAEYLDFLAVVEEDPQTAQEFRDLAAELRQEFRRALRWRRAWRILAVLAHPAALWVLFGGMWAWWLLDGSLDHGPLTWTFRGLWTVWFAVIIVTRRLWTKRGRGKP